MSVNFLNKLLIFLSSFFPLECENAPAGPVSCQVNELNNGVDEGDFNEDLDEESEDDDSDDEVDVFYYPDDEPLEQVLEIPVCFLPYEKACSFYNLS